MSRSIWAVSKHLIRNDDESLESQYSCCPNSSDSWCKFRQSKFIENVSHNDSNRGPNFFSRNSNQYLPDLLIKAYFHDVLSD